MNAQKLVFLVLVFIIAGVSGLVGAAAGGAAVFYFISQRAPTATVIQEQPATTLESLQISSTSIETTITQIGETRT